MFYPLIISSFALRRLHTNYGMGRKTNTITGASHFGAKPFMTFSSVNPMKVGDGHNMKAVEQAGECLFSDTKVSQMRGGRRVYCSSHSEQ